ncbi:WD40-repeat-containing domain protein [Pilaira anomala]|nr:WD40-repeat-containing domain protein [Pilaira anomala]
MGYLYSRMLQSTSNPAPAKPKKAAKHKVPKPKAPALPKPTVPKTTVPKQPPVRSTTTTTPTTVNVYNPTTYSTTAKTTTIPQQTKRDVTPLRSEPTGSNKPMVLPPPVNFYISPSTTLTSSPHIPYKQLPNPPTSTPTTTTTTTTAAAAAAAAAALPKKTISRDNGPSKTYLPTVNKTTTIADPLEPKEGKPTKRAKMSSDDELDTDITKTKKTSNTTRAKTTNTRGRGAGKTSTKSTTRPVAATSTSTGSKTTIKTAESKQQGKKRIIETDDEDDTSEQKGHKIRRREKPLPILNGTYKLSLVFKGHTDINIPVKDANDNDFEDAKDIWCCEFEPTRPNQLEKTNTVAICGSYTVLLLDTHQARYIKKYTHTEIQEIFYCMAWTTLSGSQLLNQHGLEEDQSCNLLAIAGRLGSIKLLNPLQNECYRYLFGHEKAVLKMTFAKTEPRWLFTASADKTVRLWDIGSPTSKEDDSVCLAKFTLPPKASIPTAISISYDLSTLMVGFDNGDMVRFHITPELLNTFRQNLEKHRSKESNTADKWATLGPLVTIAPNMIYPNGGEWHEGYIDDIYIFGQDGDKSSKLYNKIISRGADDMEFIIWDQQKSTKTDADILLSLEWPDSAGCTGVRYKVIESEGQKVLIAGEYDGQVYIYNIGEMKKSKTLSDNSVEQFKPSKMLSHPMSSELIRDISCSNDTRTIVAVDNNNTIFVWNCTD